jgi:hypothetical protein
MLRAQFGILQGRRTCKQVQYLGTDRWFLSSSIVQSAGLDRHAGQQHETAGRRVDPATSLIWVPVVRLLRLPGVETIKRKDAVQTNPSQSNITEQKATSEARTTLVVTQRKQTEKTANTVAATTLVFKALTVN